MKKTKVIKLLGRVEIEINPDGIVLVWKGDGCGGKKVLISFTDLEMKKIIKAWVKVNKGYPV